MSNLANEKRLDINLTGKAREHFEETLLAYREWQNHPEMPSPCHDVVTGEAFYAGCEGIGFNEQNGWYLVLWTPSDDEQPTQEPQPLGDTGLVVVSAGIVGGPSKQDLGNLTLLWMERGSITLSVEKPDA